MTDAHLLLERTLEEQHALGTPEALFHLIEICRALRSADLLQGQVRRWVKRERDPEVRAYCHVVLARSVERADPDRALEEYRLAVSLEPVATFTAYHAHTGLGRRLLAAGRPREAAAYLRTAIGIDPHRPDARIQLSFLEDAL